MKPTFSNHCPYELPQGKPTVAYVSSEDLDLGGRRFFCLFYLILYVLSTISQLNRDRSSWVEPVLSQDKCVLLKDHNAVTPMRLKPTALGLEKSTQPLRHCAPMGMQIDMCVARRWGTPFWNTSVLTLYSRDALHSLSDFYIIKLKCEEYSIWLYLVRGVMDD